jgi:phage terminase large subunit GpA-like protein
MLRGNVRIWEKIKKGSRNEALDCRVYNMAAKAILRPDMDAIKKRRTALIEAPQQAVEQPKEAVDALEGQEGAPQAAPEPHRRFVNTSPRRGGFTKNW